MNNGRIETAPKEQAHDVAWSRWNDKIRRIAKIGFVRDVMATYSTRIFLIVVGLVNTVVVARILGPEGRGFYAVAMAIGTLGVQFGCLGMHSSNVYFVSKNREYLGRLVGNSLILSAVVGVVVIVGSYSVFGAWPQLSPAQGGILLFGLLWAPIGTAYLLTQSLLIGVNEVKLYNRTEAANRVAALIMVVCLIPTHLISPELAFAAGLLAMTAMLGVIVWRLVKIAGGPPWPSMDLFKSNFSYGMRAYLTTFFCYLVIRTDVLMLKYLRGATDAGYYSIAFSMSDYVGLLPVLVGLLLMAKLSATEEIISKYKMMKKATVGTVIIQGPLILISAILAPFAVKLLFGKAYAPSVPAYLWLCPGAIFLTVYTVSVQFLNSIGFPVSVVWIWLVTVVLKVSLNLWLIPLYGLKGAALASSICYMAPSAAVLIVIRREMGRASQSRSDRLPEINALSPDAP